MSRWHKQYWTGADSRRARARILAGPPVRACIRCGRPIRVADTATWDVGHLVDLAKGGSPTRWGPEHRGENRRSGGRAGAATANRRRGMPPDERMPDW